MWMLINHNLIVTCSMVHNLKSNPHPSALRMIYTVEVGVTKSWVPIKELSKD